MTDGLLLSLVFVVSSSLLRVLPSPHPRLKYHSMISGRMKLIKGPSDLRRLSDSSNARLSADSGSIASFLCIRSGVRLAVSDSRC
jgi:hypothetical protein